MRARTTETRSRRSRPSRAPARLKTSPVWKSCAIDFRFSSSTARHRATSSRSRRASRARARSTTGGATRALRARGNGCVIGRGIVGTPLRAGQRPYRLTPGAESRPEPPPQPGSAGRRKSGDVAWRVRPSAAAEARLALTRGYTSRERRGRQLLDPRERLVEARRVGAARLREVGLAAARPAHELRRVPHEIAGLHLGG